MIYKQLKAVAYHFDGCEIELFLRTRGTDLPTSQARDRSATIKVCIVGALGRLGQYVVRHALDRGYQVVAACRARSANRLDAFKRRIIVVAGAPNDREVIKRAVADCDAVLTVLVPWAVHRYAPGTARAVLDCARPGARLIFSCGWHITRDGQDVDSTKFKSLVKIAGRRWRGVPQRPMALATAASGRFI